MPFSRHYFHVLSTLKSKEEYEEKVIRMCGQTKLYILVMLWRTKNLRNNSSINSHDCFEILFSNQYHLSHLEVVYQLQFLNPLLDNSYKTP